MVKINVISGFLGAGKTTLIKKLLTGKLREEKVILLENEYGEVGVDGSFMKDAGITVTELNSGCICCTLAGDFQKSIDELIDTYHPDRILVEPTGVGKLSEILAAINQAKDRHDDIEVGGSATVVDAGKCRMYMKNFGEFFLDQVKTASTIIFSRTQNLTPDRVEKSRVLIQEAHPDARIITTPWDDMDPDFMLEVIENGKPIEVHVHLHHHDHDDDDHDHDEHDHDEHEHHHDHDHDEHDHDEHELMPMKSSRTSAWKLPAGLSRMNSAAWSISCPTRKNTAASSAPRASSRMLPANGSSLTMFRVSLKSVRAVQTIPAVCA